MPSAAVRVAPATPDTYPIIKQFLLESASLYPGIDEWWQTRVVPGITIGERVCYTALAGEDLVALAIGKKARRSSKLCSLRVRDAYRKLGIGQQILHRTVQELLASGCRDVHFTINEEVLSQCGGFFAPYGFHVVSWKSGRYVKGMDELVFLAESRAVAKGLTRVSHPYRAGDLVALSVKPRYAKLIEEGRKLVEFRRRFARQPAPAKAVFYVTSPVKQFRFTATIADVVRAGPVMLWEWFGGIGGVDYGAFRDYFAGAQEGFALLLSDVAPLAAPVPLETARARDPGFNPPQSFSIIRDGESRCEALVSSCIR